MSLEKPDVEAHPETIDPSPNTAAEERESVADSLRRQIRQLKEGRAPKSLNEFIESKMSEERKQSSKVDD